jgi:hypothetical protein
MQTLEKLLENIESLRANLTLYKDSGLWQVRTDDMETVLHQQDVNESFYDFISRVVTLDELLADESHE